MGGGVAAAATGGVTVGTAFGIASGAAHGGSGGGVMACGDAATSLAEMSALVDQAEAGEVALDADELAEVEKFMREQGGDQ